MTILMVSCPNYPSLQNYAILGLPKTMSFCPKRRSFGHFRFYFLKKKKEIKNKNKKKTKKKKNKNKGKYRPYGGDRSHPRPLGVVRPPRKATKKKKTKKWVWDFGGGRTTPKALGVASATPYDR
jgi:hypothetical protein